MNKHRKSGIRIIKLGLIFLALTILLYQISIPSLKPYESYFLNPSSKVIKGNHLTATFLGTSSILLNDGETSIMTDGFITRPNIANLLLGRIKPDKNLITDVLKKTDVTNLSALITLHSHHDHAMDAPEVAMQTGALLVGSESSANIGRGWGLSEEKIRVVKSGEPLQFGKFKVTLIRSKHSSAPRLIHNLTGVEEEIIEPLNFPAPLTAFKEGGSYSVFIQHPSGNIIIQGSTNYVKGALKDYQADVVFLSIARLGNMSEEFQEEYFKEVVTNVGATQIIPVHWDNFTRSIEKPLRPSTRLLDSFDKGMSFVIQKVKNNPDIELHLLHSLDKIALFDPDPVVKESK